MSTKRGEVGDVVAETVKKEPKSATLEERPSASENNLNQPTERGERKFGAVKFLLRLALCGGLTAVCVMGAKLLPTIAWTSVVDIAEEYSWTLLLGGWIMVIIAPLLALMGCFDAKTNPIDEKEEEAKPWGSKSCVAEKNSEKTVEEPGDRATNEADDETKSGAAARRGAVLALLSVALLGVAGTSAIISASWLIGVGALAALICLAFAVAELISSLILRN